MTLYPTLNDTCIVMSLRRDFISQATYHSVKTWIHFPRVHEYCDLKLLSKDTFTPGGLFRHKRMPFGLASASAVFQRMMDTIFQDTPGVHCFQGDILMYGTNQEAHDKALRVVIQKLKDNGLCIKCEKYVFNTNSGTYLSHQIGVEVLYQIQHLSMLFYMDLHL